MDGKGTAARRTGLAQSASLLLGFKPPLELLPSPNPNVHGDL